MIGLRILEKIGLYKPLDYEHKRFDRLAKRIESPIEKAFWSAAYFELIKLGGQLTPQVEIDYYVADFVYLTGGLRLVIELDGHDYHSTAEQRSSDQRRERYLECCGYRVIRFTGSDIYSDVAGCVKETVKYINCIRRIA